MHIETAAMISSVSPMVNFPHSEESGRSLRTLASVILYDHLGSQRVARYKGDVLYYFHTSDSNGPVLSEQLYWFTLDRSDALDVGFRRHSGHTGRPTAAG